MYQVLKRDGKVVDFDIAKISDAIKMAFEAQEKQYHPTVIDFLALKVTADFEPKRSAPDLTISCKNWCAYTLSIIQKRYPRRLHFLRQFRSCPENITGEGVMDGVMKVRGGHTTVL